MKDTSMNENYVEIFNVRPEHCVPLHVAYSGDWQEAALRAAREPMVEVVVYDTDQEFGVVVYSDDPNVKSGGWWHQAINAERRRLGIY